MNRDKRICDPNRDVPLGSGVATPLRSGNTGPGRDITGGSAITASVISFLSHVLFPGSLSSRYEIREGTHQAVKLMIHTQGGEITTLCELNDMLK